MPQVAELMSFPQPASKTSSKKSNRWSENSPRWSRWAIGGSAWQRLHTVWPAGAGLTGMERVVRLGVRVATVWEPPFKLMCTFSRIIWSARTPFDIWLGFFLHSFHNCPSATSGLLSNKKTISLSDLSSFAFIDGLRRFSLVFFQWDLWPKKKCTKETTFEEFQLSLLLNISG